MAHGFGLPSLGVKMKKIGYAVLGLGIGMAHAEAVASCDGAELVALCDIDEKRLEAASLQYPGARLYRDFEELIADGDVDIVSICLPSGLHGEFAVRAMRAGKHVLVEKPIEITPERAETIDRVARETGMTAGVVHQNRFNLNMYPIKEAVDSGRLGRLFLGTFGVKWYREQKYYDRGGWRGTWELDGGGSLINQSIHTVDLMQWLMGDVESVTSVMDICGHRIETEDMTASLIKFKSGATATFVSTTCAYPGISTEIMLYGTNGTIEADGDTVRTWKLADSEDEDGEEEDILECYGKGNRHASKQEPGKAFGHEHVVHDMIAAVREGRAPQVTPSEAVKSVRIVSAIYESARTGKTVHL